jgi:hypothetical protein
LASRTSQETPMKLGLGAGAFGAKLKIDLDLIRHAESLG